MDYRIFLLPIIGAAIGWLTNYIAIKMLFRPYKPIRILGYNFQGVIPKKRKEITKSITTAIERQLLSATDLASVLEGIDLETEIEKSVEEIVEHRFKTNRIRNIPVIGLVSENLMNHLKYFITKELLKQLSKKKGTIVNKFKNSLDIDNMLTSRIDNLDLKNFEALLTDFMAKELRHIEWIGGVMGFIIGLFQVALFYLLR
jgi:uncharacterized membrane protein YheB (UPF0754 family)